ncbi:MAG: hypothetical protein KF716_18880 [Anaerolineae bacterium]|nr:hypothetical protein [Anaerolineae bacterium]
MRLLKSNLFVFLCLWVPISTPLTCQIHGLMLYMPPTMSSHHQPMKMGDAMPDMEDAASSGHQLVPVHRTLANNMLLMQMMILAVPLTKLVTMLLGRERLHLLEEIFPMPRTITPPIPPPRLCFA